MRRCLCGTLIPSNNSFKPNLLRYTKAMAEKACHGFGSTTQVGLTQALGPLMEMFDGFPIKSGFSGVDWELENCVAVAAAHPATFEVPSPDEAALAQVGDLLRLHFLITDPEVTSDPKNPRAERMWVEVCDLPGNGLFRGHLTNVPAFISSLELGDVIEFTWEHVAQVYVKAGDPRHAGART